MPTVIKNICLFKELSDEAIQELEKAAVILYDNNRIKFKVLQNKPDSIIIRISQNKMESGIYLNVKELIRIGHDLFDLHFPARKIHVHAINYKICPPDEVDIEWVRNRMLITGIGYKQLERDTAIPATALAELLLGDQHLSKTEKVMFWYYFAFKEGK